MSQVLSPKAGILLFYRHPPTTNTPRILDIPVYMGSHALSAAVHMTAKEKIQYYTHVILENISVKDT